jgi:hypothetical protein
VPWEAERRIRDSKKRIGVDLWRTLSQSDWIAMTKIARERAFSASGFDCRACY